MEIRMPPKNIRWRRALRLAAWLLMAIPGCGAAADRIMVLRADGPDFVETLKGLQHDLGGDFQWEERLVGPKQSAMELTAAIRASRPRALVLMDNQAIQLYADVQHQWKDSIPYPPSIALMSVRVDLAIRQLKHSAGIFYEVPGVTIMMNLRSLLRDPVRRVGIIHRPSMEDFVRDNAKWCGLENIEIVSYVIPEDRKDIAKAVRTGVRQLQKRKGVDAIWVLNDNFLLTPEIIEKGWLPGLEHFEKPVLVGVENFISPKIKFGTFAVLPDHYGLGVQAAGMILRLKEGDWEISGEPIVYQPLAIYKILNLKAIRKYSRYYPARISEIDKVLE